MVEVQLPHLMSREPFASVWVIDVGLLALKHSGKHIAPFCWTTGGDNNSPNVRCGSPVAGGYTRSQKLNYRSLDLQIRGP